MRLHGQEMIFQLVHDSQIVCTWIRKLLHNEVVCSTQEECFMTDTKTRKSLALDLRTYNLLQEICDAERRSKIDQLKVLIEREHQALSISESRPKWVEDL